jgi:PKD repeat protein
MKDFSKGFCALLFCIAFSFSLHAQNKVELSIKNYLEKHHEEMGLSVQDISSWVIKDNYVTKHNGIRHVHVYQTRAGIEIQNGMANITLDSDDQVLFIGNRFIADLDGKLTGSLAPSITSETAIKKAAELLQLKGNYTPLVSNENKHHFVYGKGTLSLENIDVKLRLQFAGEAVELVWIVSIYQKSGDHWWQLFLNAHTGEEVDRLDWVVSCDFEHGHDEHRVQKTTPPNFSHQPPSAPPGANQYRVYAFPLESPNHGARTLEVSPELLSASPFGWHDTDGIAGEDFTITRGNNVFAYEDVADNDAPGYSPDGNTNWDFDYSIDLAQTPSTYQDAAITNLFYACNRIHDILYQYGFTETNGNFQVNNYGNGGLGNDEVIAEAQDGGGTNNANFATPDDGNNGRMQMYLWSGSPMIDGDLDNGIVVHEYGHGISNRLTGGPSNSNCLNNDEQMGEGWSDFLGCMLTLEAGDQGADVRGIGTFAQGQPITGSGIRPAPYSTDFGVNNYTYDATNDVSNISQPHGIGFVWATMLWDLNWAFINVYGLDPDIDAGTGGNNIVLQLVMDGMMLQPCSPGFVDGRDAILLADQINNNGANQCLIWETFANRGLGYSASQGSSNSRTDQVEAFDIPPICQTPVTSPTANFDANVYTSCTGIIDFEDLSTDVPQDWFWYFGDGGTDSIQHPTHVYLTSGTYTVSLVVSNPLGSDSIAMVNFITITLPENPITVDGGGCTQDSVLLSATGSGTIYWLDSNFAVVHQGNNFYAPPSSNDVMYYAVNGITYPISNVGPVDNNFGTGGNHNTGFTGTVDFDTYSEVSIYSAWIFSGSAGTRAISLWDQYGGAGNVVQVVNVNVPFVGAGRIDLGFEVPGPGQYSIGLNNADLYRNDSGPNYPYDVAGLMSIVGSAAGPDFYYYLYDLEVGRTPCWSDSIPVMQTVDSVDFSWTPNGLTVDFLSLALNATSWSWDFGDGNLSNAENPSHTYAANGTYTVTLSINGGQCVVSYDVTIEPNSIGELTGESIQVSLFPNPAREETTLKLNKKLTKKTDLIIYSVYGQIVEKMTLRKGTSEITIPLMGLSPQVYYVVLQHEKGDIKTRLIVH